MRTPSRLTTALRSATIAALVLGFTTVGVLQAAPAKKSKRTAPAAAAEPAPSAEAPSFDAHDLADTPPAVDAGPPPSPEPAQAPAPSEGAPDGGPPAASADGGFTVVDSSTPEADNAPVVGMYGRNLGWLDTRISDRSPNQWGQTGLVRTTSARAGKGGYFDLGGHGRAFYTAQELFLLNGPWLTDCGKFRGKRDCDTYLSAAMWGSLHFGVTLFDYVELSAATVASGAENSEVKPRAILSTGSLAFSGKLSLPIVVWTRNLARQFKLQKPLAYLFPVPLALGLDMRAYLPSRANALGVQLDNFSLAPTLLATLDFYEQRKWPLRVHVNAGYIYQHALSVERQAEGRSVLPVADRRRYLAGAKGHVSAVGLEYTYWDRLTYGTGIELPLPFVTPFIEYTGEVPLWQPWKPGPFLYYASGPLAEQNGGPIPSRGNAMLNPLTWNSRLTPGLRITPGRGLAFDVAADIGIGGRYSITNGVASQWPWAVMAGMSYAFSPFVAETAVEVRQVVKKERVEVPVDRPRGRIAGRVLDEVTRKPIPNATLSLPAGKGPRFLADASGNYESYDLFPGAMDIHAEAPDYAPGQARAQVAPNGAVQVDILLKPAPRVGQFAATMVNEKDESVPASITLTDQRGNTLLLSASDGTLQSELPPGRYNAVARADGYLLSGKNIVIEPGVRTNEVFQMKLEPKKRMTVLTRERIEIKSTIFFEYNKARLLSASFFLLDEVVDTLLKNPQVTRLRVEGHTDNTGQPDYNQQLSQARAEAVRDYLVQNGVAAERLEAGGFGDTRPVAPNTTEAGRAKNRRVEFVIVTQGAEGDGGGTGGGSTP